MRLATDVGDDDGTSKSSGGAIATPELRTAGHSLSTSHRGLSRPRQVWLFSIRDQRPRRSCTKCWQLLGPLAGATTGGNCTTTYYSNTEKEQRSEEETRDGGTFLTTFHLAPFTLRPGTRRSCFLAIIRAG